MPENSYFDRQNRAFHDEANKLNTCNEGNLAQDKVKSTPYDPCPHNFLSSFYRLQRSCVTDHEICIIFTLSKYGLSKLGRCCKIPFIHNALCNLQQDCTEHSAILQLLLLGTAEPVSCRLAIFWIVKCQIFMKILLLMLSPKIMKIYSFCL